MRNGNAVRRGREIYDSPLPDTLIGAQSGNRSETRRIECNVYLTSHRAKFAIHIPVLYLALAGGLVGFGGSGFLKKPTAGEVVPFSIAVAFLLFVLTLIRVIYVRDDKLYVRGLFTRKSLNLGLSIFTVRSERGPRNMIYEVHVSEGSRDVWFGEALSESQGHRSARRLNRIFRDD